MGYLARRDLPIPLKFFSQKQFVPFHFELQETHKMNKHSLQHINLGNTYLLNKSYKQVYFINY